MMDDPFNEPYISDEHLDLSVPRRSRRRLVRRFLLFVVLVTVVALGVVIYMVRSQPKHWQRHMAFTEQTSPEQMERMTRELEARISELSQNVIMDVSEDENWRELIAQAEQKLEQATSVPQLDQYVVNRRLSDIRVNIRKNIFMSIDEINAMLLTRMDQWTGERGFVIPDEVRFPMFDIDGDRMVLAFELHTPHYSQVLSGYFHVEIQEDGLAAMTLEEFLVGQMPVPVDSVSNYLAGNIGGLDVQRLGEWLEKFKYIEFRPVLEIENRRRARVVDYELVPGGLELTVQVQDHRTYKQKNRQLAGVETD